MTNGSPSSGRAPATPSPGVPEGVLSTIEAHLRQRELRREDLYQRARRLRRLSQGTMTRLHAEGSAATELAKDKIRVNCICAGGMQGILPEGFAGPSFEKPGS